MKARKRKYNLRNLLKQNKSYIKNIFCWNCFSISKEISSLFRWYNFTASTRTGFGIDPSTFRTRFVCFSNLKWYIYGYLLQNTRGESETIEEARLLTPTTLRRGSIPLTSKLVAFNAFGYSSRLSALKNSTAKYVQAAISIQFGHSILKRCRDFLPTFPAKRK